MNSDLLWTDTEAGSHCCTVVWGWTGGYVGRGAPGSGLRTRSTMVQRPGRLKLEQLATLHPQSQEDETVMAAGTQLACFFLPLQH